MSYDAVTANWLKSASDMLPVTDEALAATWGDLAVISEIISPLANYGDALAEAQRQLAFLRIPLAIETLAVPGDQSARVGRLLNITAAGAGYEDGLTVFVIGSEPASEPNMSTVTVLRRLQ